LDKYLGNIYKERIELTEEQQMSLAFQIASGIRDIHACGLLHCDLKASNILLFKNQTFYTAKVADLGLDQINLHPFRRSGSIRDRSGNFLWQSPEVVLGVKHSESSDMFSYGLILWRIVMHGAEIFHETDENFLPPDPLQLIHLYNNDMTFRLKIPDTCPALLQSIIRDCWRSIYKKGRATGRRSSLQRIEGSQRPSADDIVKLILKNNPLLEEKEEENKKEENKEEEISSDEGKQSPHSNLKISKIIPDIKEKFIPKESLRNDSPQPTHLQSPQYPDLTQLLICEARKIIKDPNTLVISIIFKHSELAEMFQSQLKDVGIMDFSVPDQVRKLDVIENKNSNVKQEYKIDLTMDEYNGLMGEGAFEAFLESHF